MADKKYKINFEMSDGSTQSVEFTSPQGDPGFSPVVSVSDITGGHRISIADANGTQTFDVMDGIEGEGGGNPNAVLYVPQTLTDEQKAQARSNIGAGPGGDGYSIFYANVEATVNESGGIWFYTVAKTAIKNNGLQPKVGDLIVCKDTALGVIDKVNAESVQYKPYANLKGRTPVRGEDYWTEADKTSIVDDVIDQIGTLVFGSVDANNNIILTGRLAAGTYTFKYEDANGAQETIGTITVSGGNAPDTSVTIPLNLQYGKIDSSTGAISSADNYLYSDAVTIEDGKTYTLTFVDCCMATKVCYYDENGDFLSCTADNITPASDTDVPITGDLIVPLVDGASSFRFRVYLYYYGTLEKSYENCQSGMTLTVS